VKNAMLVLVLLVTALPAHAGVEEKKQRDAVDEALAKSGAELKDCGKKFKFVFDWKAYDSIDWKKVGREKKDYYSNEQNSVAELGQGLNRLCADKDYKAALAKVGTIVFKSTNDESIRVKAVITGGTMTLSNYTFGSTRRADDFESAAKAAL
jgi:hypothetical protein